jgi:hypothetical protein
VFIVPSHVIRLTTGKHVYRKSALRTCIAMQQIIMHVNVLTVLIGTGRHVSCVLKCRIAGPIIAVLTVAEILAVPPAPLLRHVR